MQSNKASPWLTVDLKSWGPLVKSEYLITYPEKTVIIRQGQLSKSVYIVKSGRVMMRSLVQDGRETVMMFVERGGLFGEEGVFENKIPFYSSVTIVECMLYRIPLEWFNKVVTTNPQVSRAVMTVLSRKVNFYANQILELYFGDVRYRIACVLLYLVNMYGKQCSNGILIDLPFTHQDMADFIKSSRVSVNKIFNEFVEHGIMRKEKQRYIIHSVKQLENMIESI